MRRRKRIGFTLIELMLVVAVIGLLAAIAIPKYGELLRKSNEGTLKGYLASLRSALSIYYSDNEGAYPGGPKALNSTILSTTLVGKYIDKIPDCYIPPYHADMTTVANHEIGPGTGYPHDHDTGYGCWEYDGVNTGSYGFPVPDATFGSIWVDCTHTDTKGAQWSSY